MNKATKVPQKILVVDDEEDIVSLLRHHLTGAGYEVAYAFDAITALSIATREPIDLIVSDIRMPGFDGFGLLAALRANATTSAVPVVFLTVLDDADSLTRAMRLGVDGYLPKPLQQDALLETVASKLRTNRNRLSALEADSVDAREARRVDDELLADDFASQSTKRESRHVSILYSDIRRFTRIAEILSDLETADLLRDYYAQAADVIRRQRGSVVRYVGDALLAAFEAPSGNAAEHAECALRAGLLLTEAAAAFRKEIDARFRGRGLPVFSIGVGVHTGDVMVCSVGPGGEADVTMIGDTVNIASRLEGATKRLGWGVVASDATVKAAGDRFIYGRRSLLVPRGRYAAVEVREVKGFAGRWEAPLVEFLRTKTPGT